MHCILRAIIAVSAIALPFEAWGDTLILNDGRTYQGVVLSEVDGTVRFEVHHHGMRMTLNVPVANIKSLERTDRSGIPFVRIPIHGRIGLSDDDPGFVTAEALQRALSHASAQGATHVVFVIDSGGGSIDEMQKILDVLDRHRSMTLIAHVEKALSAAAVIALACDEIIMAASATIGATVPWKMTPEGTPEAVDEKFLSMLRATVRSAANAGGHNVLLARGMMEADLRLYGVVKDEGRIAISDVPSPDAHIIKDAGRVLTLTASEAHEYGLATTIAGTTNDALAGVGIDSAHEIDDLTWHIVLNDARSKSRQISEIKSRAKEQAARQAARERYAEIALPRIQELQSRLNRVEATIHASERTEADLVQQRDQELQSAYQEYRSRYQRARNLGRVDSQRAAAANQWYETESARIKNRIDPQITDIRQRSREAAVERDLILNGLKGWGDNMP